MSNDFRGDPSSAMLEVLDPEQNNAFSDHYIEEPYDLSNVLFIATANDLSAIPGPLRDRMEIISIAGYTEIEKNSIAKNHLIPKQLKEHGLDESHKFVFNDAAIMELSDIIQEKPVYGVWSVKLRVYAVRAAKQIVTGEKKSVTVSTENTGVVDWKKKVQIWPSGNGQSDRSRNRPCIYTSRWRYVAN